MRLHSGLPRQGPGSDAVTAEALRRLPVIPSPARIYDLGCGPGRATLVLAATLRQKIIAIYLQEQFLEQLRDNAVQKNLSPMIETRCGDMANLQAEDRTVDLIWSEGAIYCIGFDAALRAWHPSLTIDGVVACTELSWLRAEPSPAPLAFWREAYPAMRSVAENIEAAESLGYKCLEHFTLPESSWWDEYYNPWLRNIERLKESEPDEYLRAAIANAEAEISLYERFCQEYGYEFYLLQKSN